MKGKNSVRGNWEGLKGTKDNLRRRGKKKKKKKVFGIFWKGTRKKRRSGEAWKND